MSLEDLGIAVLKETVMNAQLSMVIATRCCYVTIQSSSSVGHQPDLRIAVVSKPREVRLDIQIVSWDFFFLCSLRMQCELYSLDKTASTILKIL